jgi:regulator of RNase E activity RraA
MSKSKDNPELKSIPPPPIAKNLPISGPDFRRPSSDLIQQLYQVGSANASATLHKLGVTQTFIEGPLPRKPGAKIVGPAVTLQFMPKREDILDTISEEGAEKRTALWAVFETVQMGDVLVIQANGSLKNGCLGEMLARYFYKGRGGIGLVVDGAIRDWPQIREMALPVWTRGFTPNYASQGPYFPWAYNVPINCSEVLVIPGDIIIADDDGAVCVPANLAPVIIEGTLEREDWEAFSRIKLDQGGALKKYYPLNEEGWREYEAWKKNRDTSQSK